MKLYRDHLRSCGFWSGNQTFYFQLCLCQYQRGSQLSASRLGSGPVSISKLWPESWPVKPHPSSSVQYEPWNGSSVEKEYDLKGFIFAGGRDGNSETKHLFQWGAGRNMHSCKGTSGTYSKSLDL